MHRTTQQDADLRLIHYGNRGDSAYIDACRLLAAVLLRIE